MQNLKSIEEIRKLRKDLIRTPFEYFIGLALEGTISVYHTGNFLFLFDTPYGHRRKNEPDLASKVDAVVFRENFDLTKYNNIEYIQNNKEAQVRAFPIYLKVHKKFDVPYEHLLSANYLDEFKKHAKFFSATYLLG